MFYLNKLVFFFLNPVALALMLLAFAIVFRKRLARLAHIAQWMAFALVWFWATPLWTLAFGIPLESPYRAAALADSLPEADAIVLLGGGMDSLESLPYPDMNAAADRVWHAARLWKAGKAPVVVASGVESRESTVPLLLALGVDPAAIKVDNDSRNTYENARFTERLLGGGKHTVLLVTSAWHMTRSLGNFSETSLAAIPAPCDFEATRVVERTPWWKFPLPNTGELDFNAALYKEWLGRLARK